MHIPVKILVFSVMGFVLVSGCLSLHQSPELTRETPALSVTMTPVPPETPEITTTPSPVPINSTIPVQTATPDFTTRGSIDKTYYYIIDGTPGYIPFNVYTGVNDYILTFGDIYTSDNYSSIIDNEVQQDYIAPMVKKIRESAKKPDDEARIAISLVQHIKYDANTIREARVNESESGKYIGRYPYTILFQSWGGICGEKSFLLALLLKDLGYGVALLEFDDVNHMAVGIKAPAGYTYQDTGYALIESTSPEIPTSSEYSVDNYKTRMSQLKPTKIIPISEGKSFDTISTEYADARVQDSIHLAVADIVDARDTVIADMQTLAAINLTIDYWHDRVIYNSQGNPVQDENYQRYQKAQSEYESYYENSYLPDYSEYKRLFDRFREIYLPQQEALDKKYGRTTGFGVGL